MSQQSNQSVKSFTAAHSIPAYSVVTCLTDGTVAVWSATASMIIGIATDNASTGGALGIVIGGTAKVICNASISAGAIVAGVGNTNGAIAEAGATNTTTGDFQKIVGISLENGSTNAVIEVLLQVQNYGLRH